MTTAPKPATRPQITRYWKRCGGTEDVQTGAAIVRRSLEEPIRIIAGTPARRARSS